MHAVVVVMCACKKRGCLYLRRCARIVGTNARMHASNGALLAKCTKQMVGISIASECADTGVRAHESELKIVRFD